MKNTILVVSMIFVLSSCESNKKEESTKIEDSFTTNLSSNLIVAQNSLKLWNDGPTKTKIIEFVKSVTDESGPQYLTPSKRIATFDMDGTLLLEKPQYALFDMATKQLLKDIEENPQLKTKQPYKAIYEEDWEHFGNDWYSDTGLYSVLLYAAKDYTVEDYNQEIQTYFKNNKHERFNKSARDLVFAPMIELIEYLKMNEFDVYIVTGSTTQFVRSFATEIFQIPQEHIIGTTILTEWTKNGDNESFTLKKEFIKPINDEEGKPVNIRNKIGKVPVFAVGNSGGDYHMLQYSKAAKHSIQLIVNHDDPDREYKYHDKEMKKLCEENNWIAISMKDDFKEIFKGF